MKKVKKKKAPVTCEAAGALEHIVCKNKDVFSLLRYGKSLNTGLSTQRTSTKQSKHCRIYTFIFLPLGFKDSMKIQTLSQHSPLSSVTSGTLSFHSTHKIRKRLQTLQCSIFFPFQASK